MRLTNKVAMVTGAGSGIGAAIATRFAAEGAVVVVTDIDEGAARAVSDNLQKSHCIKLDVSCAQAFQAAVRETIATYGRLEVLINNAAIDIESAPITGCTDDILTKTLQVNFEGTFNGMKYAIEQMQVQGGGSIVNIASVAGMTGFANRPAYSAAKGAVLQLTRAMAIEQASHQIRVNALCPSAVRTAMLDSVLAGRGDRVSALECIDAMTPLPGIVTPEAVAAACLFLASDEAEFITGVTLPVDGGYTAR